jgi:hypothetical protein
MQIGDEMQIVNAINVKDINLSCFGPPMDDIKGVFENYGILAIKLVLFLMVFTKLVGIRVGIIIARDHKFAKLKRVKYLIHFYDLTSLFFNF